MIIVFMLFMATVSGYVSWAFSSVRKVRNDVRKSWHLVEGANGQRAELVTLFVTKTAESIPKPLGESVRRAHDRVAAAVGPRGADHADRQLRSAFEAIWVEPGNIATTSEWQIKFNAANVTVDEAAREYNGHVTKYEALRTSGSRKMVTELLGFDKESYFAHETAGGLPDSPIKPLGISPTTSAIEAMPTLDEAMTSTLGLLPADRVAVTTPLVSIAEFNPELFGISTAPVTAWVPPAPVVAEVPVLIPNVAQAPVMLVNGQPFSLPTEQETEPDTEAETEPEPTEPQDESPQPVEPKPEPEKPSVAQRPAVAAQSTLIGFAPPTTMLERRSGTCQGL